MCASRGPGRRAVRLNASKIQTVSEKLTVERDPSTGRERGLPKPKRQHTEASFHIQVARYLARALPEGFFFSTFPSGGGGYRRGVLLKQQGLKPGMPDLVVFNDTQEWGYYKAPALWLELKAKAGSLSQVQWDCHATLRALGHRVEVCKTLEQVEAALAEFVFPEKLKARVSV